MRALRALRPLRLVNRIEGMKTVARVRVRVGVRVWVRINRIEGMKPVVHAVFNALPGP